MPEPFSLPALKTEIQSGPLAAELASHVASGNTEAIASALNRQEIDAKRYVPRAEAKNYLHNQGVWVNLQNAADGTDAKPALVRNLAKVLVSVLKDPDFPDVNPNNAQVGAVLDGLIAGALLTAAQKTGLLALADIKTSRAEALWGAGTVIGWQQVSDALYRTGDG